MEFEWSEAKRLAVVSDRNLDFIDAPQLFDGRPLDTLPSPRGMEQRWIGVGELNERLVAVVWTLRDHITMRRARRDEERRYRALYG
jgi:uncharacterized protein